MPSAPIYCLCRNCIHQDPLFLSSLCVPPQEGDTRADHKALAGAFSSGHVWTGDILTSSSRERNHISLTLASTPAMLEKDHKVRKLRKKAGSLIPSMDESFRKNILWQEIKDICQQKYLHFSFDLLWNFTTCHRHRRPSGTHIVPVGIAVVENCDDIDWNRCCTMSQRFPPTVCCPSISAFDPQHRTRNRTFHCRNLVEDHTTCRLTTTEAAIVLAAELVAKKKC